MSKLQKPLTPLELVMRNLPRLSAEEKLTVAKWLALQGGVELWSKAEAQQAFADLIQKMQRQHTGVVIPEIIRHG